jgi:transmembrane sensor
MASGADPSQAEFEANEWLVRLEEPDVGADEIARFQLWLAAAPQHKSAWADAVAFSEALPAVLKRLPADADIAPPANDDGAGPRVRTVMGRSLRTWGVAGAALGAAVVVGLFMPLPAGGPPSSGAAHITTHVTAARESAALTLADGSRLELSPLARARVDFSGPERRVWLSEGAAYFDIVADAARPFVVATPYGEVRVLGTAFAVRVGDGSADVIVTRGLVETRARAGGNLWSRLTSARESALLHPNEAAALGSLVLEQRPLAREALEQRLAWRDGQIAMEDVSLRAAADEVTRFSGVVFEIEDRALAGERVSLVLDGGDVEGFLALLEGNLGVRADWVDETRVMLDPADPR